MEKTSVKTIPNRFQLCFQAGGAKAKRPSKDGLFVLASTSEARKNFERGERAVAEMLKFGERFFMV